MLKALREHRSRRSYRASQRIERPCVRGPGMHLTQGGSHYAVADRREPPGTPGALLIHV